MRLNFNTTLIEDCISLWLNHDIFTFYINTFLYINNERFNNLLFWFNIHTLRRCGFHNLFDWTLDYFRFSFKTYSFSDLVRFDYFFFWNYLYTLWWFKEIFIKFQEFRKWIKTVCFINDLQLYILILWYSLNTMISRIRRRLF